jgi:hypothetical protein
MEPNTSKDVLVMKDVIYKKNLVFLCMLWYAHGPILCISYFSIYEYSWGGTLNV